MHLWCDDFIMSFKESVKKSSGNRGKRIYTLAYQQACKLKYSSLTSLKQYNWNIKTTEDILALTEN